MSERRVRRGEVSIDLLASERPTPRVLGGEVRTSPPDHHPVTKHSKNTSPCFEIDLYSARGLPQSLRAGSQVSLACRW